MEKKVEKLEKEMKDITGMFVKILECVEGTKAAVESTEKKINTMEKRMDNMEKKIDSIERKIDTLTVKVDKNSISLKELVYRVEDLEENFEKV